ncbi:hypothetical protein Tco_0402290 [Tanacetum coccineum]
MGVGRFCSAPGDGCVGDGCVGAAVICSGVGEGAGEGECVGEDKGSGEWEGKDVILEGYRICSGVLLKLVPLLVYLGIIE